MLGYWLQTAKVDITSPDSLKEFILHDQFLSSLNSDLYIHLKERGNMSLSDTVECADNWLSAHSEHHSINTNRLLVRSDGNFVPTCKQASKPNSVDLRTCFNCNSRTPLRRDCPLLKESRKRDDNFRAQIALTDASVSTRSNSVLGSDICDIHDMSNITVNSDVFDVVPLNTELSSSNVSCVNIGNAFNNASDSKFWCCGTVNGMYVSSILRDTGCNCVIISKSLLPNLNYDDMPLISVSDFLGIKHLLPQTSVFLKCMYYTGWVPALVAALPHYSVLIGNIDGVQDPSCCFDTKLCQVVTRPGTSAAPTDRNASHPLFSSALVAINITPDEFCNKQHNCPSLKSLWHKCSAGQNISSGGSTCKFVSVNNVLYRECIASSKDHLVGNRAIVLPIECRNVVMRVTHDTPFSGHFSYRKTLGKILADFFWPGCSLDVKNFVRSCEICQRICHRRDLPVPMCRMPIISEPFSVISIDITGPIEPTTSSGHKYILTIIDDATGFPEAIPLRSITSIAIAEALVSVFSRLGIPNVIRSDQGSNFTSKLMSQLHNMLAITPIFSSIYHPQGNGRVEHFHSTLKLSLRKLCVDRPRDWNKFLVCVLFAIREMPGDRTGLSPFELLYGRRVRGPTAVLRDLWGN